MNENEFFKFELFFAEKLIEDRFQFQKYRGKAQNHITLKVSSNKINQRQKQNDVVLEYDGLATRKSNIKDMLGRFVYLYILKINDYIAKINKSGPSVGLETKDFKADFCLYYFQEFSGCLKNLKVFVGEMSHINLIDDIDVSSNGKTQSKENKTVINEESSFIKSLRKNCEDLNANQPDNGDALKLLSNQYIDHLKNEMLHNRILFLISSQYNTKFYLNKVHEIIFKLNGSRQQIVDVTNPDYDRFISGNAIKLFDIELKKLQTDAFIKFSESEYIEKHFTTVLNKNVKTLDDWIIVEKMICDYHNMLVYLANLYRMKKDSKYSSYEYYTISPISFVNYNCRIIDGIEIKFINSAKFGEIKAFDKDEKEVKFLEGFHYFINSLNRFCCPSEVLKRMKINKILFSSKDYKFMKAVEVGDYLSI
jgi:hypothetical protein